MFVDYGSPQIFGVPFEHSAGRCHCGRQRRGLLECHRLEDNGHCQCGNLLGWNAGIREATDEKLDLCRRQLTAIPLFLNDISK